jgi:AraC-like DNA-binding protein
MSGQPYIDGSTLDECREAIRQGVTLESLASRLRCSSEHLSRLLGIAQAKPVRADKETGCDLWAADKLEGVL